MEAYITRTANFFPNAPVSNDSMEHYLGMINGEPSRARRIVLARNGIKNRYYALDEDGEVTHTNVQMAANAVRNLMGNGITLDDIDLLSCGTASPEQLIPSHGVMVHGELGGKRRMEVVSFAGSGCTGMDALKYAMMAVRSGEARNAVVSASERLSAWMKASYFQSESELFKQLDSHPILAFQKEFLRWMLSDGAEAVLVQDKPSATGLSLHIDWIEKTSFANEVETCMYAGAEKDEQGNLLGWSMFPEQEWLTRSLFALKQDTRMLGEYIIKLGCQFMSELGEKRHFTAEDIDWFMPHLSSMYFKAQIPQELKARGFDFPEDRWFVNLPTVGNIASASAFAMIDELMHSGRLKKGQKMLLMVPESARFSFSFCMLTVC